MNIPKISPVAFRGTLHTPETKEWTTVLANDKNLSRAVNGLSRFVKEKLDEGIDVQLSFYGDEQKLRIDAGAFTGVYSKVGFIERSGSNDSLQNNLLTLNA